MKIEVSFFAMLLVVPVLISDANATELVNKHATLIQQGCQMWKKHGLYWYFLEKFW
jgi:hypothetical protein